MKLITLCFGLSLLLAAQANETNNEETSNRRQDKRNLYQFGYGLQERLIGGLPHQIYGPPPDSEPLPSPPQPTAIVEQQSEPLIVNPHQPISSGPALIPQQIVPANFVPFPAPIPIIPRPLPISGPLPIPAPLPISRPLPISGPLPIPAPLPIPGSLPITPGQLPISGPLPLPALPPSPASPVLQIVKHVPVPVVVSRPVHVPVVYRYPVPKPYPIFVRTHYEPYIPRFWK